MGVMDEVTHYRVEVTRSEFVNSVMGFVEHGVVMWRVGKRWYPTSIEMPVDQCAAAIHANFERISSMMGAK